MYTSNVEVLIKAEHVLGFSISDSTSPVSIPKNLHKQYHMDRPEQDSNLLNGISKSPHFPSN